jgi:DNA-binding XRE family transcriptional regulator
MVVRNQEKLLKKQFQQVLGFQTMTSVEQEGEKDSPSTTANSIAAVARRRRLMSPARLLPVSDDCLEREVEIIGLNTAHAIYWTIKKPTHSAYSDESTLLVKKHVAFANTRQSRSILCSRRRSC